MAQVMPAKWFIILSELLTYSFYAWSFKLAKAKKVPLSILNALQALAKSVDKMHNSKTVAQLCLPVHFKWLCSKAVPWFYFYNNAITFI